MTKEGKTIFEAMMTCFGTPGSVSKEVSGPWVTFIVKFLLTRQSKTKARKRLDKGQTKARKG